MFGSDSSLNLHVLGDGENRMLPIALLLIYGLLFSSLISLCRQLYP
jgi:hypothetical protein